MPCHMISSHCKDWLLLHTIPAQVCREICLGQVLLEPLHWRWPSEHLQRSFWHILLWFSNSRLYGLELSSFIRPQTTFIGNKSPHLFKCIKLQSTMHIFWYRDKTPHMEQRECHQENQCLYKLSKQEGLLLCTTHETHLSSSYRGYEFQDTDSSSPPVRLLFFLACSLLFSVPGLWKSPHLRSSSGYGVQVSC